MSRRHPNDHALTAEELHNLFGIVPTGCPACGKRHPFAGLCPSCREDQEPPHYPTVPSWATGDHEERALTRDCGNL